jgi:aspartate/methionine/tyrosine aminotransferase
VFSRRLSWDLRPNPLSALLEEKRRADAPVLDLTESNPTRAGFAYPDNEILSSLANPAALRYDPSPRGLEAAREAVVEYYAAHGVAVASGQILLTASTSEAYAYIFKLLCDPGDEVLVPRPSYPLFDFLAQLESVCVRQYPLRYDGAWHLDFAALEAAVSQKTRALVVVNPNNPTGSFLHRDELARLETFAAARGLAILSDEVFTDYPFTPDPDRVATLAGARTALTFSMNGLSKIAGLPQMKLGWIVVSGPGRETALERMELIADTYLSVGTPVQAALTRLLAFAPAIQAQIRARTAANLVRLREALAGSPATMLEPEGGWYAVLQVPRTRTEEEWTLALLRDHDVLVQPGFFFDFETEAFLVVSLLTPPKVFAEGVSRLRSIL